MIDSGFVSLAISLAAAFFRPPPSLLFVCFFFVRRRRRYIIRECHIRADSTAARTTIVISKIINIRRRWRRIEAYKDGWIRRINDMRGGQSKWMVSGMVIRDR